MPKFVNGLYGDHGVNAGQPLSPASDSESVSTNVTSGGLFHRCSKHAWHTSFHCQGTHIVNADALALELGQGGSTLRH